MRPLKIRAWNTIDKVMIDDVFSLPAKQMKEVLTSHHYVKMQFTGDKDKNGIDIYEADYLHESCSPASGFPPKKDGFSIVNNRLFRTRLIKWLGAGAGYKLFGSHYSSFILGNKYENPEIKAAA